MQVRYWAAAREAAGTTAEEVDGASLAAVLAAVRDRHGARMTALLPRCLVLVDGEQTAGDRALDDGALVELLPPYAGGAA